LRYKNIGKNKKNIAIAFNEQHLFVNQQNNNANLLQNSEKTNI